MHCLSALAQPYRFAMIHPYTKTWNMMYMTAYHTLTSASKLDTLVSYIREFTSTIEPGSTQRICPSIL
jgi:hypothetical protein